MSDSTSHSNSHSLYARVIPRLSRLYGAERAASVAKALIARMGEPLPERAPWSERDAILITYAGSIRRELERPLSSLQHFLTTRVGDALNAVHLLPFFPSSSDGGFAVVDYLSVDPVYGDWSDVAALAGHYDLMLDLVLNHVSAGSAWFQQYLAGQAPGKDYFIEVESHTNLREVVRPRVKPLLTAVETAAGTRHVWATFSDDQIDLNFENPDVLLELIGVLVAYLRRGARFVRLDAVAFLWKRIGTTCIHLPETHEVIRLMRDVVDAIAPGAVLITETNVPHAENISYFGRSDEAQMVYQFALPPLVLSALYQGDGRALCRWAADLSPPPRGCTFLNFTASHDGIGLRPVEGLLNEDTIEALVAGMRRFGGYVSSRAKPDGSQGYYEINITYFDALMGTKDGKDPFQMPRFIASQLIAMSLQGIPAIYIHALTATPNDHVAVDREGHLRAINRHEWDADMLETLLDDPESVHHHVFKEILHALSVRRAQPAFHPEADQQVLELDDAVFCLRRVPNEGPAVLVIANLRRDITAVRVPSWALPMPEARDLLTGRVIKTHDSHVELARYAVRWLVAS